MQLQPSAKSNSECGHSSNQIQKFEFRDHVSVVPFYFEFRANQPWQQNTYSYRCITPTEETRGVIAGQ
jgi:hypothetical protein